MCLEHGARDELGARDERMRAVYSPCKTLSSRPKVARFCEGVRG